MVSINSHEALYAGPSHSARGGCLRGWVNVPQVDKWTPAACPAPLGAMWIGPVFEPAAVLPPAHPRSPHSTVAHHDLTCCTLTPSIVLSLRLTLSVPHLIS